MVAATLGRTEILIKMYHDKTLWIHSLPVQTAALNGRLAIVDMLVDMGLPQEFEYSTYVIHIRLQSNSVIYIRIQTNSVLVEQIRE